MQGFYLKYESVYACVEVTAGRRVIKAAGPLSCIYS